MKKNDDKTFDVPTDPDELKARLYGIVADTEGGEDWYWDGPTPMPEEPLTPPNLPNPTRESPQIEKR